MSWYGSWFSTWCQVPSANTQYVQCHGLFSDVLYRPFFCANISLDSFISGVPTKNAIVRLPDLLAEDFEKQYSDLPFILTEPVKRWQISPIWTTDYLRQRYGNTIFRAEAVDWPLRTYLEYLTLQKDESPLYLFDRSFVEKMNLEVGVDGDYQVPECFGQDLFTFLGSHRPDHRWLIIGPERSGSTFHKDPNATSAWNAVIRGAKYWIMFPGTKPPPGVFVSKDQSEVTSPLSIAEWLIGFHAEARKMDGCKEGICREGEVLHVPSGWWHLVVNLEPSIAITQNFVPKAHLGKVVDFLSNKADQVSGFRAEGNETLWDLFKREVDREHPELISQLLAKSKEVNVKRKWDRIVDGTEDKGRSKTGFSFGFASDEDGVDIP